MIKNFIILLIINATLILAQEFDVAQKPQQIRIGVGIMLTLNQKIELLKKFETRGSWNSLESLEFYDPFLDKWLIEEWETVKNYEGSYLISNLGRLKSLEREIPHSGSFSGYVTIKPRIRKWSYDEWEYQQCRLAKKDKKSYKSHHLVWDHFGDKNRNGHVLQIDHILNNKSFNWIKNLRLVTNRENCSKDRNSELPVGVNWDKCRNKFVSKIRVGKKRIFLGRFSDVDTAVEAYKNALKNIIDKEGRV